MAKRLNTELFIQKAREVHDDKYDYHNVDYKTSRDKVEIICPKHGVFSQKASSHLQGNGCPNCAKQWTEEHKRNHILSARKSRGFTNQEWIERARKVHDNFYDYSKTQYVNQRTNVIIICPKHGEFEQKADSHIRGKGCSKCGYESENHYGVHDWTLEQYKKIEETCLKRYGAKRYLDSDEGIERMNKIRNDEKFKEKMSKLISSSKVQNKTIQTNLEKYGVESPMQLSETVDKMHRTKKLNGTWSTSKPEEKMYNILLTVFDETDVIRQYKSKEYPFYCDFYIKSLDLYIELNATWLHGDHWFDCDNKDDVSALSLWNKKIDEGKPFYKVAIDVWTVRDIKKRNTAIANNLNYLTFWNNDLSDFHVWLTEYKNGNIILNNIK